MENITITVGKYTYNIIDNDEGPTIVISGSREPYSTDLRTVLHLSPLLRTVTIENEEGRQNSANLPE